MSDLEPHEVIYPDDDAQEIHQINTAQVLRTHRIDECEGRPCCIHGPSQHRMRDWMRWWRSDRGIMERICEHGVGHPDPDDVVFHASAGRDIGVHGCDGCCHG